MSAEPIEVNSATDDEPNLEGSGQVTMTSKSPAMALPDMSEPSIEEEDDDVQDDAMTKFLDGDRPTSVAGEPSHNVPRKVHITPWCITTSIWLVILSLSVIITLCISGYFEESIQSLLHYMVDDNRHNDGQGGFDVVNLLMMLFCMFNTAVFAMCGNLDYLLMVSCGYLYGDDDHEWLMGATIYIAANYAGCAVSFAIGRALFRDKLYWILSKHEKYRYFKTILTDNSLLVSFSMDSVGGI